MGLISYYQNQPCTKYAKQTWKEPLVRWINTISVMTTIFLNLTLISTVRSLVSLSVWSGTHPEQTEL